MTAIHCLTSGERPTHIIHSIDRSRTKESLTLHKVTSGLEAWR